MTIEIPGSYQGPDGSANGGYTCGLLASSWEAEAVEVTLRQPPPLDRKLDLRQNPLNVELYDEETLIATARASVLDLELPNFPIWEDVERASERYAGHQTHPFPNCFVCGPKRALSDGLRIFAGPLVGTNMVAASWRPGKELTDEKGFIRRELLWCALDCPGAFAVDQKLEKPRVLGRLTAQLFHNIQPKERVRVLGWPLGEERRKAFAGTALVDSSNRVCAVAKAVWIAL